MGKTGTSAVQAFLNNEGALLAQNGLFDAGMRLHKFESGAPMPGQNSPDQPARHREGLAMLAEEAAKLKGIKTVVWSNEAIAMSPRTAKIAERTYNWYKGQKTFDEIEIVLVFRRQDDWIESAYRQWGLKHKFQQERSILSVEDYLPRDEGKLDYYAIYKAWCILGQENVKVISFDDARALPGGVVEAYAGMLGVPWTDELAAEYGKVYASLGPSLSYFNAVYNSGYVGSVLPPEFKSMITDYKLPELSPKNVGFVSTETRQRLLDANRESNRMVAREALGREELFDDRPVKEIEVYKTGERDVLTYLTMINKIQHDRLRELMDGNWPFGKVRGE